MDLATKERFARPSKKSWSSLTARLAEQKHCIKLLLAIISKVNCNETNPDKFKNIILDLAELKIRMGLTGDHVISDLKAALTKIKETTIPFENDEYWEPISFINAPRIYKQTRLVTLDIEPRFIPHLTALQDYLVLKERLLGATNRAIMLYSAIKLTYDGETIPINFEELQKRCRVNYSDYGSFKAFYLLPAIKELKSINVVVTFKEHKPNKRVEALSFTIKETEQEKPKKQPKLTPLQAKAKKTLENLKTIELSREEQEKAKQAFAEAKAKFKKLI